MVLVGLRPRFRWGDGKAIALTDCKYAPEVGLILRLKKYFIMVSKHYIFEVL
jgi:hypothetical protein